MSIKKDLQPAAVSLWVFPDEVDKWPDIDLPHSRVIRKARCRMARKHLGSKEISPDYSCPVSIFLVILLCIWQYTNTTIHIWNSIAVLVWIWRSDSSYIWQLINTSLESQGRYISGNLGRGQYCTSQRELFIYCPKNITYGLQHSTSTLVIAAFWDQPVIKPLLGLVVLVASKRTNNWGTSPPFNLLVN